MRTARPHEAPSQQSQKVESIEEELCDNKISNNKIRIVRRISDDDIKLPPRVLPWAPELPEEILEWIFKHLGSTELISASQVSRQWHEYYGRTLQNPLLIPRVITQILLHLTNLQDILNCRLVCKLWTQGVHQLTSRALLYFRFQTQVTYCPWSYLKLFSSDALEEFEAQIAHLNQAMVPLMGHELSLWITRPFGSTEDHAGYFRLISGLCSLFRKKGRMVTKLTITLSRCQRQEKFRGRPCFCYEIGVRFLQKAVELMGHLTELNVHEAESFMCKNELRLKDMGRLMTEVNTLICTGDSSHGCEKLGRKSKFLTKLKIHTVFRNGRVPDWVSKLLARTPQVQQLEFGHVVRERDWNERKERYEIPKPGKLLDFVAQETKANLLHLKSLKLMGFDRGLAYGRAARPHFPRNIRLTITVGRGCLTECCPEEPGIAQISYNDYDQWAIDCWKGMRLLCFPCRSK